MEYIFYKTDASFDYDGPFGTCTHHCEDLHGFSISYDNDKPDIETLEGFGDFCDVEDCKSLKELRDYLVKNIKQCEVDYWQVDELIDDIDEILKKQVA